MKKVDIVFCLIIITISLGHAKHTGKVIRKNGNCECGILPETNRFKRQITRGFKPVVQQIVKGFKTKINEYPWVVGLHSDLNCRKTPVCGGALISSQHVVTAAHCVEGIIGYFFKCPKSYSFTDIFNKVTCYRRTYSMY